MLASYKTVIEASLLSLALGACGTAGTASGDGNAGADDTRGAPIQTDDIRCDPVPGSPPADCQFIGSGQMSPSNRK